MTIVVDTSAVVAMLRGEPDAERFPVALALAYDGLLSSANFLEAAIVLSGNKQSAELTRLRDFLRNANIAIVAVDSEQAEVAATASLAFGRVSGHPARLDFGDCFSYAPAKTRNLPPLYKGSDFVHTDIASALQPGASA